MLFKVATLLLFITAGIALLLQYSEIHALKTENVILRGKIDAAIAKHTEDINEIGIKIGILNGRLDEMERDSKRRRGLLGKLRGKDAT